MKPRALTELSEDALVPLSLRERSTRTARGHSPLSLLLCSGSSGNK
eukprot:NP_001012744.2 activator of yeast meiotic promoters 1 [Mus musculus]